MLKAEKRILEWIDRKRDLLFLLIMSALGLAVRIAGLEGVSGDMTGFLLKWFEEIKEGGGFAALGTQVGDYNIPYQVIIAVMTYLPFEPMYMFKAVSIFFDYVLAAVTAGFVTDLCGRRSSKVFLLVYSAVLFVPTIIFNSAVWGQCDAIYVTFAVAAVWMLYRRKWTFAFIMLGVSFAFKLQAIFILPFFLYYYIREKSFSLFQFLWIPVVDYVLCIPAFLAGRSLKAPIRIYLDQAGNSENMWANFPSFWILIGNDYSVLKGVAIVLTIALLGLMMYLLMAQSVRIHRTKDFVAVLCWSIWTCVLFLPAMHERYAYMLDLLLLAGAIACTAENVREERKISAGDWWPFFLAEFESCCTYGIYYYHASTQVDLTMLAIMYTAGYAVYTCGTLKTLMQGRTQIERSVGDRG